MSYIRITVIAAVAAVCMQGVQAGELEFVREIQQDFGMALEVRQEQDGLRFGKVDATGQPINLNIFTGSLGVPPPQITFSGDPDNAFAIEGLDDQNKPNFIDAVNAACDQIQADQCKKIANAQNNKPFDTTQCDDQRTACQDTLQKAPQQLFLDADPVQSDDEFDFFCALES